MDDTPRPDAQPPAGPAEEPAAVRRTPRPTPAGPDGPDRFGYRALSRHDGLGRWLALRRPADVEGHALPAV